MHKSVFSKIGLTLLGLTALASAQFKYWDVADPTKAPALISQTGLYTNITAKTMHSSANLFEVNSALWSDGSYKRRWFILKPNTKIGFKDTVDYWTYPDSAVFVKDFSIDTIEGDAKSRVLWETRFLILKKELVDPAKPAGPKTDKWYGFSYRWNKAQTDAALVSDTGENAAIRVRPIGKPAYMKKWKFPSPDDCRVCHNTKDTEIESRTGTGKDTLHGRTVLGFFTAQINRNNAAGKNQIIDFFDKGLFSGTKPSLDQVNAMPRWYGIEEPLTATVTNEKKARAYIAANCSGCHGTRGMTNGAVFGVTFNYDYHTGVSKMTMEYQTVSWSYGLDQLEPVEPGDHPTKGVYLVTPGYPQKSAIVYRQTVRNTKPVDSSTAFDVDGNQMPPRGSFEVNDKAMKVLEDWIKGIPQRSAAIRGSFASQPLLTPAIQGRTLKVPTELLSANTVVSMTGIDGRVLKLTASGDGVYNIPGGLTKGIYIVRVGAMSFTRYLF
ncbi:MAG TPA: hypothetical protein VK465_04295 [Fibrobacteria bacterium]|nr:hypothetical protein [Fibrobacteria bacterium]